MPHFTEQPRVERNPNERASLVALVKFETGRPVITEIEIDDGRKRRKVVYDASHDPRQGLPVVGMRADTDHSVRVTVRNAAGESLGPVALCYRTPPLPGDSLVMPRLRVPVAKKLTRSGKITKQDLTWNE